MRKLETRKIVVASHNAGKIREINDLIGPMGFTATSAAELNFAVPDETGTTFEENAAIKALASARPQASRRCRTIPACGRCARWRAGRL